MAVFPEQQRDDEQGDDGKQNQQRDLPLRGRIGKQAEGRPRIFGVDDFEESGNDGNAAVQREAMGDHRFREAVERDDEERDEEVVFPHFVERF